MASPRQVDDLPDVWIFLDLATDEFRACLSEIFMDWHVIPVSLVFGDL
jgi:hypothetical protein